MAKNSLATLLCVFISFGCTSVLSRTSDEEAWNGYFKELQGRTSEQSRVLASAPESKRAGVKILRQMLQGLPLRNYLLSCEQKECFQGNLVVAFDQAFQRVKDQGIALSREEYTGEQKLFLESYSYENVFQWVESFHQSFLSGVELRTAQRAMDLAHDCEKSEESFSEARVSQFSLYAGGLTYLPRAYYSCLNDRWAEELEDLLKETMERLGVTIKSEEAKRWILQRQISPIYRKTLNEIFDREKQREEAAWSEEWKEVEKGLNWKLSLEELISKETPRWRKKYRLLNLESFLTKKYRQKNGENH